MDKTPPLPPRPGRVRRRSIGPWATALISAVAITACAAAPTRTLPAEFEPQGAIVLSADLLRLDPVLLVGLVALIHDRIPVVILVRSTDDREEVVAELRTYGLGDAPLFAFAEHDSLWTRDFGPIPIREGDRSIGFIDAAYSEDRPLDDAIPSRLAELLSRPMVPTRLRFDGGNLLSNGDGLLLTTDRMLARNATGGRSEQAVLRELNELVGARKTVLLRPLVGEPTGHVDMFAIFTSTNTIVVASIDPKLDPENAALLDVNAAAVAGLKTSAGPLAVVRLPLSRAVDGSWHSPTNVIFANGTLLVPVYAGATQAETERVLATYTRLLPTWAVVAVDATAVARTGGSLHCVARELPVDADSIAQLRAQPFTAPPRAAPPNPLTELARVRGSYSRQSAR